MNIKKYIVEIDKGTGSIIRKRQLMEMSGRERSVLLKRCLAGAVKSRKKGN